ncbi:hypothetical protein [Sphingobium sp. KCTC 72723]|uniref:hypothetical protein n=1 Tax=Sphingobium sp. KCTC 72723 TaxID=2733867 RepID=UPI00165D65B0|nr:hypothetical protein [Sphingobium sp. KCTC 72723]
MSEFDDFADEFERQRQERLNQGVVENLDELFDQHHLAVIGRSFLEMKVQPILDDARRAYEARGLRVEIKESWTEYPLIPPILSFQIFGNKARADNSGTYGVAGLCVTITHDGNEITVGMMPDEGDVFASRPEGCHDLPAVRAALKEALVSVYGFIDRPKA